MAWSFEALAGVGWVVFILALMIIAMFLEVAVANIAPLLIPVVGYILFVGWVFRVK